MEPITMPPNLLSDLKTDEELFDLVETELYTPVVGDVLDELGYYNQFLPQPIQPMRLQDRLAGRAMPVLMTDAYVPQHKPFGKLAEALDQLQKGDIYIATGGSMRSAYWGELLTAAAAKRGARGAVIDGFHNDTAQVLAQYWPVFSRGRYAQSSSVRTQVADYRCNIEIQGVCISPGDLIFCDLDGVLVVPQKIEKEVITKALQKNRREKLVRQEIENGMSTVEVFARYGIL